MERNNCGDLKLQKKYKRSKYWCLFYENDFYTSILYRISYLLLNISIHSTKCFIIDALEIL